MKQYDIYVHREDSGIYKVIEAGSNLSNFDIPNFRYYGTIEEGQCFYELIDDGSSDGDVIISSLGNDAALDGSYENFVLNAREWADGELANYYDPLNCSCSCSLVKRWVTPEGEVGLETMYDITIDGSYFDTVDDGKVNIDIEKDKEFVCQLSGFSYGEARIICTLLTGCGYKVTSYDGRCTKYYNEFWTEDDSERILNAVYPDRIENKEKCARTRKKYTKVREEHKLRYKEWEAELAKKYGDNLPF